MQKRCLCHIFCSSQSGLKTPSKVCSESSPSSVTDSIQCQLSVLYKSETCNVTGEGHKTRSIFRRRLSRVEVSRTSGSSKMLEPCIVQKLKKQLDCPQRRRRLNLGSPRPKLRLLSTGNSTTTKSMTTNRQYNADSYTTNQQTLSPAT